MVGPTAAVLLSLLISPYYWRFFYAAWVILTDRPSFAAGPPRPPLPPRTLTDARLRAVVGLGDQDLLPLQLEPSGLAEVCASAHRSSGQLRSIRRRHAWRFVGELRLRRLHFDLHPLRRPMVSSVRLSVALSEPVAECCPRFGRASVGEFAPSPEPDSAPGLFAIPPQHDHSVGSCKSAVERTSPDSIRQISVTDLLVGRSRSSDTPGSPRPARRSEVNHV